MGFQDCLHKLRMPYASRGGGGVRRPLDGGGRPTAPTGPRPSSPRSAAATPTFQGSLWDRGILPQDTLDLLAAERGGYVEVDRSSTLDWEPLRARIKQHGMRNSNCMAIAPTATIANIIGVSASIEPTYQNLYVKSNLSGEFTVVNEYLVPDLKQRRAVGRGDGRRPQVLRRQPRAHRPRARPSCAGSMPPPSRSSRTGWSRRGARRQKWIDQSQSLNIYMAGASGKKLDETYKLAWMRGLKTTYYLRALGATHAEKSTSQGGRAERGADRAAASARRPARADRRGQVLRHRQPRMRGCQ